MEGDRAGEAPQHACEELPLYSTYAIYPIFSIFPTYAIYPIE
jgi:hypothetical protein